MNTSLESRKRVIFENIAIVKKKADLILGTASSAEVKVEQKSETPTLVDLHAAYSAAETEMEALITEFPDEKSTMGDINFALNFAKKQKMKADEQPEAEI